MSCTADDVQLHDLAPQRQQFRADVLRGLTAAEKSIPCKYLYDDEGSRLFDRICELPEYYPTRTELRILRENIDDMAAAIGPGASLIEFGSGSSLKTRILLDHLPELAAYVPIDISKAHLVRTAEELNEAYPSLPVMPVCADFTKPFTLPDFPGTVTKRVVYFPGSTIGNFTPDMADRFLVRTREICGSGGGLLIGIDLDKDVATVEAAYNDAQGVTASFNLNLLARINRELGADFRLDRFRHLARYNKKHTRIESFLISRCDQKVHVDGVHIPFTEGEAIFTEYSHKFTLQRFAEIVSAAGFDVTHVWTDDKDLFSVQYIAAR